MEDSEFKKLLDVCRLKLDEKDEAKIKKDLDEVIKYFDTLDKISCEELQPAYHPIKIDTDLREDDPKDFADKGGLLGNTKTHRFYVIGPDL